MTSRALLASVLASCALLACAPLRFVDVVSENQGSRIEHIVIHFTSVDFAESLRLLTERTERPVSAHYLVPENGDPTYSSRRLRVYRLVGEDQRAWHAGLSHWRGDTALNSSSIGIEIVNRSGCAAVAPGNEPGTPEDRCEFRDYDAEQIELVIELVQDILRRHPGIDPVDIVGHADIAPDRRLDPGPKFPWRRLYEHGIGAWYDEDTVQRYRERFEAQPPALALLQRALAAYGYDVDDTGEHDARTQLALRAFQMHFRPSDWSGQPDAETAAIVFALLEKYRPRSLDALTEPEFEPGVSRELARQRAATVSGLHYELDFVIPEQPDADIGGRVVVAFDLLDDTTALALDFTGGADRVRGVSSNGEPAAWRAEREHIVIPAAALTRGRNEVEIEFVAGSAALNRNPNYLYTLFVPDRARTAFPLFDQPDLKATFDLTLTVPSRWRALSNATVESVSPSGSGTTHRFRRSAPISPYVFAFVAGEFESVTGERDGRSMTMLHRETDAAKLERNVEAIFDLHAAAIDWLEDYTGIDYPFEKLDFALIPAFQYNGMEHAGAILYRARSLLLDEAPSDMDLLGRASLIAHETAHMWFGNLVTMEWFDDVWLKEVFANFMAARIVNPSFPAINHELNFLVRHAPAAYSVDRTAGANPIRQPLSNLNEAGQLYGPIIYNKAPIMMRQLESLVGEEEFRAGLREYLDRYAFANASWPDLIDILDATTDDDLAAWSEVWVNTPGRPLLQRRGGQVSVGAAGAVLIQDDPASDVPIQDGPAHDVPIQDGPAHDVPIQDDPARDVPIQDDPARDVLIQDDPAGPVLLQNDPAGSGRVWPQQFEIAIMAEAAARRTSVLSSSRSTPLDALAGDGGERLIFNSDGRGYGLFPADAGNLLAWDTLGEVERAAEHINLYENMLAGADPAPGDYFTALLGIAERETNQLLLGLVLDQLSTIYWNLLPTDARLDAAAELESMLWQSMLEQADESSRKVRFDAFADIATTPDALRKLHDIWSGSVSIESLPLSENDLIALAQSLAIRLPTDAETIFTAQLARTENPDNRRRLEFIAPSLSADVSVRDAFFASLAQVRQREVEPWVLEALENLHHPLRIAQSENYVLPSLQLLEQIQSTGDIFFPSRWLDATLANHRSPSAVATVYDFLDARPDYNAHLRAKILQAADPLLRANALTATGSESLPRR